MSTSTRPKKSHPPAARARPPQTPILLIPIVRVSARGKRKGDSFISPELQLEGMREWVERNPKYELAEHLLIEEMDVSGATPLAQRRGLARAIDLVEEGGGVGGVIGVRLDRLARDPEVWAEMRRRVRTAGGVVVAAHHGGVRGDLPEEELTDDVGQAFAKYEVSRARHVYRIARERAVARGVAPFTAPAGYDKIEGDEDARGPKGKLVPNGDAPAIRAAFEARADGQSINEVARLLDERGVRSRAGRPRYSDGWSRPGTARLLRNRAYLGELAAGPFVNPSAHDAIVDEALFLSAQRPGTRLGGRESRYGFWLSKVTRCAACGGALVGSHVKPRPGAKFPIYRCTTKGCPEPATISAKKLEPFVEELLRAHTPDVEEQSNQGDDEGETLETQRLDAQRELDAWRKLPVADLDLGFYAEGMRERRERLDSVLEKIGRRQAEQRQPRRALTVDLWEDWAMLPVEEKRAVARDALDRVEVRKGALKVPLVQRIFVSFVE